MIDLQNREHHPKYVYSGAKQRQRPQRFYRPLQALRPPQPLRPLFWNAYWWRWCAMRPVQPVICGKEAGRVPFHRLSHRAVVRPDLWCPRTFCARLEVARSMRDLRCSHTYARRCPVVLGKSREVACVTESGRRRVGSALGREPDRIEQPTEPRRLSQLLREDDGIVRPRATQLRRIVGPLAQVVRAKPPVRRAPLARKATTFIAPPLASQRKVVLHRVAEEQDAMREVDVTRDLRVVRLTWPGSGSGLGLGLKLGLATVKVRVRAGVRARFS
jgi:hypothetical protein